MHTYSNAQERSRKENLCLRSYKHEYIHTYILYIHSNYICYQPVIQVENMNPGLAALVSKPIHHGEEALVAKEFIQGQPQRILEEYRIVISHTEVVDVWDDALACVITYAVMYVCIY